MKKTKKRNPLKLILILGILTFIGKVNAQYCTPTWVAMAGNCSGADLITNVSIAGTVLNHTVSTCNGTSRYKDFTGNTPAIVYKNFGYNSYTLSVTANSPTGSTISLWIDLNQDSSFSTSEWWQVTTSSVANAASTVNITIPDTAISGSTIMRIRTRSGYSNGAGDACTQFGTGVAYDYSIIIDSLTPCAGQPTAGNVFAQDTVCNGDAFSLVAINGTMGLNQSYQWQFSKDNVTWTNITSSNKHYIYTSQYSSTYYRFYTTCSSNTDTASSQLIFSKICYCTASAKSTLDDDIGNFTMGSYSNGSDTLPVLNNSKAISTYSDFTTAPLGTFFKGKYYNTKITQINGNAFFYGCFGKVFIDFDQSGTFDAGEEVDTGQTYSGNRYISGNVYIPFTAKTGYTRLRVILRENASSATTTACGNFNYGEVEDYTILILDQAQKDITVIRITNPSAIKASCSGNSNQTITVKIQNTGTDTLDFSVDTLNIGVDVDVSGSITNLSAKVNNGILAPAGFKTITLTTNFNMAGVGIYSFSAWSQMNEDTILINDSATGPLIIIQQIITPSASSPYFQNFENGNGNWTSGGIASSWVLGSPAKSIIDTASVGGSNCWNTSLTSSYNLNEQSYIESPCFNLSGMDSLNTAVSFDIWWNCERDYDGLTLQISTDNGGTWNRLGNYGEGTNWYNDTIINTTAVQTFIDGPHCWSGRNSSYDGSGGWIKASHLLPTNLFFGTVKFRFAFAADYAVADDGIAIDNFYIYELPSIDAVVNKLVLPVATPCKNSKQDLTVQILNAGTDTLDLSVDPITITIKASNSGSGTYTKMFNTGIILSGTSRDFNVTKTFNMGSVGTYNFKVYCYTANDGDRSNDTNLYVRNTASSSSLPVLESFDGGFPAGYTASSNIALNAGSGIAGSRSLRISLNSATPYALAQTPTFGTLGKLSALKFDYRFSTTLSSDDTVNIYISIDCGVNFFNIYQFTNNNSSNSTYKTFQYDLGQYVGNNVTVVLEGKYGSINFLMDIDNFAIGDKPNINLGNDTAACNMLLLDANPNALGWALKWSNGHNTDTNTITVTNDYWVKATDVNTGIYNYDTIHVDIYSLPIVSLGNDTTVCSGSSLTISAGQWPSSYKFSWSNGDTIASIVPPKSGIYICSVISPGGCIGFDTIKVTINSRPSGVSIIKGSTFNGSFNNGTNTNTDGVCVGNKIIYEMTAPTSYSNAEYGSKWVYAGVPIFTTSGASKPSNGTVVVNLPGAKNGNLEFIPTAAEAGLTYILSTTITDLVTGCDTTVLRYIDVTSNTPLILGADKDICPNDSTLLDAGTALSYLWSTGDTTQTIWVDTAGTYGVTIIRNGGCFAADSININILPTPNANFSMSSSTKNINCTPADSTNSSYAWDFGDGGQSNIKNTSHIYAADGTYAVKLTVTDKKGCTATATKTAIIITAISNIMSGQFKATMMPNPYRGEAALLIDMDETKIVKIELYDMAGRLLNTLKNGMMAAGEHRLSVNTANSITIGVYNIRISIDNEIYNIKVVDLGQ
ncbi:MAG: GEVED domain-containing protein [Bacteroidota bacterium]|nr:GEVED domain-containing protein [Bacteroidota bacterium]